MDKSKKYVTYLTIYSGNLLPPFYIGSSTIDRINKGYKGSVSSKEYSPIWKNEIINNPHLFSVKIISYHTTRKSAIEKELFFHEQLNVVDSPLYINRAKACKNGFFGRVVNKNDHPRFNKRLSDETKHKISESVKKAYKSGNAKVNKKINESGWVVCCDFYGNGMKVTKEEYDMNKGITYFNKTAKYIFIYDDGRQIISTINKIEDRSYQEIRKYIKEKKGYSKSKEVRKKISDSKKGKSRPDVSEFMKGLRKNTCPAKCSKTGTHLGNVSKDDPRWVTGEIVGIKKVLHN